MNTEGLFLSHKKVISQVNLRSYSLSLLATGGNVDVVIYDIREDKPCCIFPGERPDLLEFFYILDGTAVVKSDDGDMVLQKDEFFHVFNLKESISFRTVNGARLLYVSSQPMFKYLTEYHESLNKLLDSAELKDLYTYNHGQRVQMYATMIGERMGLPQDRLYTLKVSSLFHDIGKNAVPDHILKKPDKLTREEYVCIQQHSTESRQLLEGMFEPRILAAVEQHHERLDGSGYPHGLLSDDIVLEARIIAVADAYDAMTSDRAYRRGLSAQAALDELERSAHQYDTKVVAALREILQEEGSIGGDLPSV